MIYRYVSGGIEAAIKDSHRSAKRVVGTTASFENIPCPHNPTGLVARFSR